MMADKTAEEPPAAIQSTNIDVKNNNNAVNEEEFQEENDMETDVYVANDTICAAPPAPAAETSSQIDQVDITSKSSGAVGWLLVGGAVGAGLLLLRRMFKRSNTAPVSSKHLFQDVFSLDPPSLALLPSSSSSTILADRTFVVSDRLDVLDVRTKFGCTEWQATQKPCTVSAQIVDQLLQAGAKVIATVPSWPLGLRPSVPLPNGAQIANPAGRGHYHGGGEYGAAIAAASGAADLCVAVDEVGSTLIPGACCGAYVYRPTSGVLQMQGIATGSATLGTTCLLSSDPQLLAKVGMALEVPGGGTGASGVVSQYLVAEDLFALCGEEVQRAAPAVVAAVKRWAGPEHAQGLSLCNWLYARIPALAPFMPRTDGGSSGGGGVCSQDVLEAMAAAVDAIQRWEWLRSPYGKWAASKLTSSSGGAGFAIGGEDGVPEEAFEAVRDAKEVSETRYRSAIRVAEELSNGMRAALQQGYVFVVPTAPGPAPRARSKGAKPAVDEFRRRCEQFAALSSLAGVPQVAMPLPMKGGLPVSISMVTLQRRDLVLLKAAAKLGPMLATAMEEEERAAAAKPAAPPPPPRPETSSSEDRNAAMAEAAKEEGNAAFKAGRYDEAVKRYSEAIRCDPGKAVYFSNRAMAYLKQGRYSAAEADCDAALEVDPVMVKALLRRGSARLAQGGIAAARADFQQVLEIEPRNRQAKEELSRLNASFDEDIAGSSSTAFNFGTT